jgi:hypothetical protein
MAETPGTTVTATGAGGLTIRFGDRVAHCDLSMPPEQFAESKAACDRLLREAVTAMVGEEARNLTTEARHG